MAVLTEGKHNGEFIVSESNGTRSRGTGILITGQNLEAGTLLGMITATSKLTQYAHGAVDGSETVHSILVNNVDATDADVVGVAIFERDGEVNEAELTYSVGAAAGEIATANTELEALGILAR